jgi:uncharacterized membrane protein
MPREKLRTLFLTGVAVMVPVLVSSWILLKLVGVVQGLLGPLGQELREAGFESTSTVVALQLASLLVVAVLLLVIGALVQLRYGRAAVERVDDYLGAIPGIGTVYQTARQMSDMLLHPDEDDEAGQFRDVKLVEFPGQGTYTLGFLTSESPPQGVVDSARDLTGDPDGEYHTLFLPMAPNPFMGGHLTHVPAKRVHDVDITVESAVQYILTTGVVDSPDEG